MKIGGIDEILDKATEIIALNGIEHFSLSILAKALNMNKASLYHYFSSKEVMMEALHDKAHERLMKKGYRLSLDGSFEKAITSLIHHWEEIYFSDESYNYMRLLLSMRVTDERALEEYRSIEEMLYAQSDVVFTYYESKGEIEKKPLSSRLFSALIKSELERGLIENESGDIESLIRELCITLTRGKELR